MKRILAIVAVGLLSPLSFAQTTNDDAVELGNIPSVNLRAARSNNPGSWVQRAISRHNGGETPDTNGGTGSGTGAGTGAGSGTGGLGLGDLGSLLGSLGGSGLTGANTSDLLNLLNQVGGSSLLGTAGASAGTPAGSSTTGGSSAGTGAALTKNSSATFQTTQQPQEETKFWKRLANSLLTTTFAAITVGLSSQAFIDVFKDMLRPAIAPDTLEDESTDQTDETDQGDGGSVKRIAPLAVAFSTLV